MTVRRRGAIAGSTSLDELDRGIVEALQADGRESFRNIARQLGVAEGTVRNRYERLVDASVLDVVGVTNPLALGFEAIAMVGVKTNGRARAVADAAAEIAEVSYVVVVAGGFDLMLELVCRDHDHLLDVTEQVGALDGVLSTDSFVYLRLTKQNYAFGQPPRARD